MESLLEQTDLVRRKGRYWRKIRNIIFLTFITCFLIWGGIRYYYPHTEGIKSGKINQVVYKGLAFKTYEGKLIMSDGISTSEEFDFSVAKKSIADKLMHAGGKTVELHYKEYYGVVPWRGETRFIVDKIVDISDNKDDHQIIEDSPLTI
jgi:hypothetical protein